MITLLHPFAFYHKMHIRIIRSSIALTRHHAITCSTANTVYTAPRRPTGLPARARAQEPAHVACRGCRVCAPGFALAVPLALPQRGGPPWGDGAVLVMVVVRVVMAMAMVMVMVMVRVVVRVVVMVMVQQVVVVIVRGGGKGSAVVLWAPLCIRADHHW